MPTTCNISFENPQRVFYSGHWLRGTVQLNLTRGKIVRGVYIDVSGEGYAYWKKDGTPYTGTRNYLSERMYLVGGTHGTVRMTPGSYIFKFKCLLADFLPTSFEGKRGHIRYTAKCVIEARLWPDEIFHEPFTVIRSLDLNSNPVFGKPLCLETKKSSFIFWLFCGSTPINIKASTPVRGYTPGQTINLKICVNGQLSSKVSEFTVQFIRQITYCVYDYRKREKHILIEKCVRNEIRKEYTPVNITVPSVPPTTFLSRNIIRVEYVIRIIGTATFCFNDPVLEFPITIGTNPIRDTTEQRIQSNLVEETAPHMFGNHSNIHSNSFNLQQPSAPSIILCEEREQSTSLHMIESIAPAFKDILPKYGNDLPTYEEAMQLCDMDDNKFRPKYPIFRRPTSYSIE